MALDKLTFTKDWTNPSDFPTYEGTESQVRSDMQLLHNETKSALNNLIDDLESTTDNSSGADQIGVTAIGGKTTVQSVLEDLDTGKVDKVSGKGLSTNDYDNSEKGKVAANTSARHTHNNKELLDTYNQTNADIKSAVDDDHTHSNKTLLDSYTQTEVNLADAVTKKHSHSNKSVLDGVSSSDVANWNGKITNPASKSAGQFLKYNGSNWIADEVPLTDDIISVSLTAACGQQIYEKYATGVSPVLFYNDIYYHLKDKVDVAAGEFYLDFVSINPDSAHNNWLPRLKVEVTNQVADAPSTGYTQLPYYTKPSGGIPANHLSSEVQSYLALADTAIQEPSSEGTDGQVLTTDGDGGRTWTTVNSENVIFVELTQACGQQVTDMYLAGMTPVLFYANKAYHIMRNHLGDLYVPEDLDLRFVCVDGETVSGVHKFPYIHVYSHNNVANAPTTGYMTLPYYEKPSDGIPSTDMTSAVQTSLGKADSALQSHQDISGKEDKSNKVTSMSASSTDTQYPSAKAVYDELAGKQETLTFDSTPTSASTNPVTSGGVYTALSGKVPTSRTVNAMALSSNIILDTDDIPSATYIDQTSSRSSQRASLDTPVVFLSGLAFDVIKGRYTYTSSSTGVASSIRNGDDIVFDSSVGSTVDSYFRITSRSVTSSYVQYNATYHYISTTNVCTNKFVTNAEKSTWNAKEDASNKVTSVDSSSTDAQYPSAKLVYTALGLKENTANKVTGISSSSTDTEYPSAKCVYDQVSALNADIANKQATLVSGTNIKTINSQSLLGSGDITIQGGGGTWGSITGTLSDQTDLANALNGKMDDWVLLWTNASPTSAFAGQIVTLDLSPYSKVLVVCKGFGANSYYTSGIIDLSTTNKLLLFSMYIGKTAYRYMGKVATGITFDGGKRCDTYGVASDANEALIPWYIYGIK